MNMTATITRAGEPAFEIHRTDGDTMPTTLPNVQRLRAHLAQDSLAAALLAAWEAGEPAQAQVRMLAALHEFHAPKQAATHETAAQ
jgi:hypothetical protein